MSGQRCVKWQLSCDLWGRGVLNDGAQALATLMLWQYTHAIGDPPCCSRNHSVM